MYVCVKGSSYWEKIQRERLDFAYIYAHMQKTREQHGRRYSRSRGGVSLSPFHLSPPINHVIRWFKSQGDLNRYDRRRTAISLRLPVHRPVSVLISKASLHLSITQIPKHYEYESRRIDPYVVYFEAVPGMGDESMGHDGFREACSCQRPKTQRSVRRQGDQSNRNLRVS